MRKYLIIIFSILILLILGSALPTLVVTMINSQQPTDVTASPNYNFSSFSGTVWKTKVKMALADIKEYTGVHHMYLLAPKHFDSTQSDYIPPHDTEIGRAHV